MNYNFDKIIDRRGSGAISTDVLKIVYGRDDLTPLWVADMDFETPDCIRRAIEERLEHQIYGYSVPADSYWQSIIDWEARTNGWKFTRDQLTYIPGIVRGISYAVQCFTAPGDAILVQPPVYMPFLNLPRNNGRRLVFNPLEFDILKGTYTMNFENLEEVCAAEKPKMMILSNPHNPAGVVWSKDQLAEVAEICGRHGVLVISDEIHGDMPLFGNAYTPYATVSEAAAGNSICFAAPSKTFNIAGLVSSFTVVCNPEIRSKFFSYLKANELDSPTFFATVATEAAFSGANGWRLAMLRYVEENVEFVESYLKDNIPGIKAVRPQASFLIWLDCTALGLGHDSLVDLFVNRARLALNDGEAFGPGGEGHMRLNAGCPRIKLERALNSLKTAVDALTA